MQLKPSRYPRNDLPYKHRTSLFLCTQSPSFSQPSFSQFSLTLTSSFVHPSSLLALLPPPFRSFPPLHSPPLPSLSLFPHPSPSPSPLSSPPPLPSLSLFPYPSLSFPPLLSPSPSSLPLPPLQLGSTAVGMKTEQGVVLAVEKRVTSVLMEPSTIEKILEIDSHIGNKYTCCSRLHDRMTL